VAVDGPTAIAVEKEMSISHKDFFRILPKALEGSDYRIAGNRIIAGSGDRRLEITLSEETQRRIALLTLPVTHVRLDFIGYGANEAATAIARFDRGFQRGGG
jgi:hypothetical protein